jgi:hypothetical protein
MQGFFLMEDLFFKNRKIIKLYHHANTENKWMSIVIIACLYYAALVSVPI